MRGEKEQHGERVQVAYRVGPAVNPAQLESELRAAGVESPSVYVETDTGEYRLIIPRDMDAAEQAKAEAVIAAHVPLVTETLTGAERDDAHRLAAGGIITLGQVDGAITKLIAIRARMDGRRARP